MKRPATKNGATVEDLEDLKAFAKDNPIRRGKRCWLCHIPEASAINASVRQGFLTPSQVWKWLIEKKGYPAREVTKSRINGHFYINRHHER